MKQMNLINDFLQTLLNAKKMVNLYQKNNPMYSKAIDNLFTKATDIFQQTGDIIVQIEPQALLVNNEQVYSSKEQHNNFAFLFFKEGLRELTFTKDVTKEELEDFLNIISLDDKELLDNDIVSLLWDRNFKSIKYVVDEDVYAEEDGYESKATQQVLEQSTPLDKIMAAYHDAFTAEDVTHLEMESPSESDYEDVKIRLERDSETKLYKIINIIFELFWQAKDKDELKVITSIMKNVVGYLVNNGNIENLIDILKKISINSNDEDVPVEIKESLKEVVYHAGSPDLIRAMGPFIDNRTDIDEETLNEFAASLENNAIRSFIELLGELKNYAARKMVIHILTEIGRKDISALLDGLADRRWYLVRNLVLIIKQIGDMEAAYKLITKVKHTDIRVRTEVIKTIGDLKITQAISFLEESLDAAEQQVRISAVRAIGHLRSEKAKQILIQKIKENKAFIDKNYDEKKIFFEVLSLWKEDDVAEFFSGFLKINSYFSRKKLYETKACAAYALGRIGNSEYLPLLKKHERSSDPVLRENVRIAIRSLARERG
jgi:HEAT repeat protein